MIYTLNIFLNVNKFTLYSHCLRKHINTIRVYCKCLLHNVRYSHEGGTGVEGVTFINGFDCFKCSFKFSV